MTGMGVRPVRLFLTATLIVNIIASLLGGVARGDDLGAGNSIRIRAAAPIGKMYSNGDVLINGHPAYGEEALWGGELVQVSNHAAARIAFDSLGQVALDRGTTARMAVRISPIEDRIEKRVLVISLISGAARVALLEEGSAFLQAGGSEFTVAKGSIFRVDTTLSRALIDVLSGKVETVRSLPKRYYFVSMSEYDPLKSRATQIRIAQVLKKKRNSRTGLLARSSSTENGSPPRQDNAMGSLVRVSAAAGGLWQSTPQGSPEPGANRKLKFDLKEPGVGELLAGVEKGQSVTVLTDPNGNAPLVTFVAERQGSTMLIVSDVTEAMTPGEERRPWECTIEVEKGLWEKHRGKFILGAAAAVAISVILKRRSKPLQQEPPPNIP